MPVPKSAAYASDLGCLVSRIWLHIPDYQGVQQHETNGFHCFVCQDLVAHQANRNVAIPMLAHTQSKPAQEEHACQKSDKWQRGHPVLGSPLCCEQPRHDGCSKA